MAKCKNCNEEKVKKPKIFGKHTLFIDDQERRWNGKQCPDCYKAYNKERMRKVRKDPSLFIAEDLVIVK
jgi:hypothetical protein